MSDRFDGRFDGKVAMLTGAASGMGRAIAMRLASEGATVVGLDVNRAGLDETAGLIGDAFTPQVTDVRDRDSCHQAVQTAVAEHGHLDVLGNIAGVVRSHLFTEVTQEEYDLIMGVNVEGVFWMAQAAMPAIIEANGTIVNIASNAGLMGQAYTVAYATSKAAVVNFTRSLAMEYMKHDVRINAIAPGGVNTPMTGEFEMADGIDFSLMRNYMGYREMAEPEAIANVFAFLASDEAANVHGSIWSADGGLTAS